MATRKGALAAGAARASGERAKRRSTPLVGAEPVILAASSAAGEGAPTTRQPTRAAATAVRKATAKKVTAKKATAKKASATTAPARKSA